MNQYFNFTRFGRLLRKHTTEHGHAYLMVTAVLAGAITLFLGVLTYLMHGPLDVELQSVFFLFGVLAAGGIFTSSVFAALGEARNASSVLLLPASHLEKYLVAWLYSLPVFGAVYTVVFLLIDALTLQLGNHGKPYHLLDFTQQEEWLTPVLSYALLHSIALWSALFFKRLHAIKTAFLVFGSATLLAIGNSWFLKMLINSNVWGAPFGDATVQTDHANYSLVWPISQQMVVLVPLALAMLLWLAAYARLIEKQI